MIADGASHWRCLAARVADKPFHESFLDWIASMWEGLKEARAPHFDSSVGDYGGTTE